MSPTEKPSVGFFSAARFLVGNPLPCPVDRASDLRSAKCALVRAVLIWHEAKLGVSDSRRNGAFEWLALKALGKKGKSPGD